MFDCKVPPDVIYNAFEIVAKQRIGKTESGGIIPGSGSLMDQFVGYIGQGVISTNLLHKPITDTGKPDGGWDILIDGMKIDVKTMGRNSTPRINQIVNFPPRQKNTPCDYLLFTSLNKNNNIFTVCGMIKKKTFFDQATYYPDGAVRTRDDGTIFRIKAENYELPIASLSQINAWKDIRRLIHADKHSLPYQGRNGIELIW